MLRERFRRLGEMGFKLAVKSLELKILAEYVSDAAIKEKLEKE